MKVLKKKKIRIDTPTLYRKAQKRIRLKGASTRICDLGYLREEGRGERGALASEAFSYCDVLTYKNNQQSWSSVAGPPS